jgi:hypothetical protein
MARELVRSRLRALYTACVKHPDHRWVQRPSLSLPPIPFVQDVGFFPAVTDQFVVWTTRKVDLVVSLCRLGSFASGKG